MFVKNTFLGPCLQQIRINQARVAYVANLHTQANQEKHDILYNQLTEILSAVNAFRLKTQLPDDGCIFDAICGDFNFDNLVKTFFYDQQFFLTLLFNV